MLMSPLQDWDGNTTEIDADRVLAICTLLILALIGNLISSFLLIPLRKKNGIAGAMLMAQAILITAILILAALKWFPRYTG